MPAVLTPQQHLAVAALIRKAAKVEADLTVVIGQAPTALQLVLMRTRKDAIDAVAALIETDPTETALILALQAKAGAFIDLIEASKLILSEADEAERTLNEQFDDDDKQAVSDLVLLADRRSQPSDESEGEG